MPLFSRIAQLGFLAFAANAHGVGSMPTPVLKDVRISAGVVFDPASGYTYSYAVANPAGNTGEIRQFTIDVTVGQSGNGMAGNTSGLTIPLGSKRLDFTFLLSRFESLNAKLSTPGLARAATIVPFGQNVPSGWNGGLGNAGYASFSTKGEVQGILPGSRLAGFQLRSFGVPTVRRVQLIPFWMHVVEDHDAVSAADMRAAGKVEQDIVFNTMTLGASWVSYGSIAHWDQLRGDLAQAAQLGWITDKGLASAWASRLASARQALDARDLSVAKVRLRALLDTIDGSTAAQRTSEGVALTALNVRSLIDHAGDKPVEPRITLPPPPRPATPAAVGGPDLAVFFFIPPLLTTAGGRTFYVTEQTRNVGNAATPPTVTRYYISSNRNFDPRTARSVGARAVPALQPGEFSMVKQQPFTIPGDLPEGTYFLAACADADNAVAEPDKSNNCSPVNGQGR